MQIRIDQHATIRTGNGQVAPFAGIQNLRDMRGLQHGYRLQRNSSHQFLTGLFVGLFATVGAAAPVISSAKIAGISALIASPQQ